MSKLTPCHRQESEQEAESRWVPSRIRIDLSEDVTGRVLVLLHDKKGDTAREQHRNVDHSICAGNLGQPGSIQAVDKCVEHGQGGHDSDNVSLPFVSNHYLYHEAVAGAREILLELAST